MDPLQVASGLCGQRVIYSRIIQMRLFYRTNTVCTTRNPSFLVVVRLSNRFDSPIAARKKQADFLATIRLHSAIPFFCFAFVFPISIFVNLTHFRFAISDSDCCLLVSMPSHFFGYARFGIRTMRSVF